MKLQRECNMNIIIVSGGGLEKSALAFLREKQVVIAVDGGLQFCYDNHIAVNYVVGDFDTIHPQILEHYRKDGRAEILEYCPEKDLTDTKAAVELAVKLAKEQQRVSGKEEAVMPEIVLLGGIGSRMDHTLANIGCLCYGLERGVSMKIIDAHNCMYVYDHSFEIERKNLIYKKYLSLIALSTEVYNLTIRGMKYETRELTLPMFSSTGVSNELQKEKAEVTFTHGLLLVIESRD